MRQMDQMSMDPFGSFGGGLLALPDTSRSDRRKQQQRAQSTQVVQRSQFVDSYSFSNVRSMTIDMHGAIVQMSIDSNAPVYEQHSVMSYSNTGDGAPKIYQASSSCRHVPGGVKETIKTVRDSETGVEKVAVGHHINERAHVRERSRNNKTGEQVDNQEFINLDEEEAQPFDQEYKEKWHAYTAL